MLTVTQEARERLAKAIDRVEQDAGKNACFRITPGNGNQLQLALEDPQPDDLTFEEQDRTVLAVPAALADALQDRTIDVQGGPEGHRVLTLK